MSPRFQVELRVRGRLVESTSCGAQLTIGEGGGLVVPGLGGEVVLVHDGRVVQCAGLSGESDGVRGKWVVDAHPELEISVEPLEAVAIERGRMTMVPTRETLIAGALACCLAAMLGRTAMAGTLTEPEREKDLEPDETAITLAVFSAPIPPPVFVPPPIVQFAEIVEPEPEPEPAPPPRGPDETTSAGDDEDAAPGVIETVVPTPPKRKRRAKATPTELVAVLSSADSVHSVLGSTNSGQLDELLAANVPETFSGDALLDRSGTDTGIGAGEGVMIDRGLGGVEGGVPGGVSGGGPGGVAIEPAPTADPFGGKFDLADAFVGHPALASGQPGTLTAILQTSRGPIHCTLFEDQAPRTVANFVGLALGTRPWRDDATGEWRKRKLYSNTTFHRIVKGFVIQGGDPRGDGTGGPGYTIDDEIVPDLKHDAAGVLSMANRGKNTGGSQFFVTLDAAPHIDGTSTVFGRCDVDVVRTIGDVEVGTPHGRPVDAVTIRRVEIVRRKVEGPSVAPPELEPRPHAEAVPEDAPPIE